MGSMGRGKRRISDPGRFSRERGFRGWEGALVAERGNKKKLESLELGEAEKLQ